MIKIQILGTGCPNCKRLAETAEQAAKAVGLNYEIEKVTDIQQIMAFGVAGLPAMAVDGIVKFSGRIPSLDEIKKVLSNQ